MGKNGKKYVLAGDIGGTKTFLGAFIASPNLTGPTKLEPIKIEKYTNAEFASIESVVEEFCAVLGSTGGFIPGKASATFGVAGPVVGGRRTLTNMNWEIDGPALKTRFKLKSVTLINDLVATGWGVRLLGPDELVTLQGGVARPGNAALIAAGTGLGEAILSYDGERHIPTASEGGHTDFAPRNDLEIELLKFMMERYGHVSYERVLSGGGLKNLYDFFSARAGVTDESLNERFGSEEAGAVISSMALDGSNAECVAALELFISLYGSEAGNLALKSMAVGGIYVGGGIAPKIIKVIEASTLFMDSFKGKGRFDALLSEIPVYIILNEMAALHGAAFYASQGE